MMTFAVRAFRDGDALPLYRWQRVPSTRQYSTNTAPPTWEEHMAWVARRYPDPDWLVALADGEMAACAWLEPGEGEIHWISIVVAPEARGQGIGTRTLKAVTGIYLGRYGRVMATVHVNNAASLKMFKACGYSVVPSFDGAGGSPWLTLQA